MTLKIGDKIKFLAFFHGVEKTVDAKVIDIYSKEKRGITRTQISVSYQHDDGDSIIEHFIPIDSEKIFRNAPPNTTMTINVVSLFNGISVTKVALDELGIACNYYSSEICKHAIEVSRQNHGAQIIELGDITRLTKKDFPFKVHLLVGGSPCQNLSRQANDTDGVNGDKSILFYDYVRLLHELSPDYFIFENVASMSMKDRDIISKILKCEPVMLDAQLVSAQKRKRLFWANFNITPLINRYILWEHVVEPENNQMKRYYYDSDTSKYSGAITANGLETFKVKSGNADGFEIAHVGDIVDLSFPGSDSKRSRVNTTKTPTLMTGPELFVFQEKYFRLITQLEAERLQSLPDGYTSAVSKTKAYELLGNAFNKEVIKHIVSCIPFEANSPKKAMTAKVIENYPGAKFGSGVYQKIINEMPVHDTYIEGCLGSGAIMLNKLPAKVNVGIDIDVKVIEAWKVAGHKHIQILQYDIIKYLRSLIGKGLDNRNTLIYLDPPYLKEVRRSQLDLYNYYMESSAHEELLKIVNDLNCNVIISGYDGELYDKVLKNWRKVQFKTSHHQGIATETLWCNFSQPKQLYDTRYVGNNFRERERIKRKGTRWVKNLKKMPPQEQQFIIDLMRKENLF